MVKNQKLRGVGVAVASPSEKRVKARGEAQKVREELRVYMADRSDRLAKLDENSRARFTARRPAAILSTQ